MPDELKAKLNKESNKNKKFRPWKDEPNRMHKRSQEWSKFLKYMNDNIFNKKD